MLRKITPILFLFTVILSSCSKDDDVAPAQASVEGTWTLDGIDLVVDSKVYPVTTQGLEDNYYANSVYEFKSDGTFVITDFEEDSYEGTYSFDASGNTLTLVEDGDEVTYLVQVDGSSLVLSSPTIDVNKEETTEEEDFWLFSFFFLSFDQEGTIDGEGDAISMDFKFTK
ncbi:lipocalin family protein [Arcticibacterium luteifluviistationis]|uniref:Uncharacterized protein n=1 Tax=Arcticibacterium luteifluviistationis TaxID=1784714 RepID=A0A2Z4GEE7_9BACT|nr:lipocalin family protein [Arcticibacterium luteifluviistationis]AWV99550.1 hypothetical protein DJ013_15795 [Arcticibacterium luteifluviistationis]